MDRISGIAFSFMVMLVGWAFAPFDTQPVAALWVSVVISIVGFVGLVYFDIFQSEWWKNKK